MAYANCGTYQKRWVAVTVTTVAVTGVGTGLIPSGYGKHISKVRAIKTSAAPTLPTVTLTGQVTSRPLQPDATAPSQVPVNVTEDSLIDTDVDFIVDDSQTFTLGITGDASSTYTVFAYFDK